MPEVQNGEVDDIKNEIGVIPPPEASVAAE